MDNKSFTDQDKTQFVEFLNFIATRAQFSDWKTEDTIKHFKLLAHMQQSILPKIEAHTLEILQVRKPEDPPKKEERAAKNKDGK